MLRLGPAQRLLPVFGTKPERFCSQGGVGAIQFQGLDQALGVVLRNIILVLHEVLG